MNKFLLSFGDSGFVVFFFSSSSSSSDSFFSHFSLNSNLSFSISLSSDPKKSNGLSASGSNQSSSS